MTNDEKVKYLNESFDILSMKVQGKSVDKKILDLHFNKRPKSLYKYRNFSEYAWDSLENNYIYLASANKMDDPFECSVNFDFSKLYDENSDSLQKEMVDYIIAEVIQYCSENERDNIKNIIYSYAKKDFTINNAKALSKLMLENNCISNVSLSSALNIIENFPEQIQSVATKEKVVSLLEKTKNLRKDIGMYSLSEDRDNQVMWAMYADNYKGFCIEYDFENEIKLAFDTLPVIYQRNRNNNVLRLIVATFLGAIVSQLSQEEIFTDKTQYLSLFLAKHFEWAFQNEWRVIGGADSYLPAPKIKAIYLGKNCAIENRNKIVKFAKRKALKLYMQEVDVANFLFTYIEVN